MSIIAAEQKKPFFAHRYAKADIIELPEDASDSSLGMKKEPKFLVDMKNRLESTSAERSQMIFRKREKKG